MVAGSVSVSRYPAGNLQVPDPGERGPEWPQPSRKNMHHLDPGQESDAALPQAEVTAT